MPMKFTHHGHWQKSNRGSVTSRPRKAQPPSLKLLLNRTSRSKHQELLRLQRVSGNSVTNFSITHISLDIGPVKPKLVARAPGSDRLPWKIGRKVPQIQLREVPTEVRPVLSYVLWRLHESDKGRADASTLIVLSDDCKTHTVGQKLDIVVKRTEEIRRTIAAQVIQTDRNTLGDLEREFGVRAPRPESLQNGLSSNDGKDVTRSNGMQPLQVNGEGVSDRNHVKVDILNQTSDGKEEEKHNKKEINIKERFENHLDDGTVEDRPTDGCVPQEAIIEIECCDLPKQSYSTVIDITEEHAAQEKDEHTEPAGPGSDEFVSEKISNITAWIKNLAPKLSSISEPNSASHQGTYSSTKAGNISPQPQAPMIQQPVVLQRAAELFTPSHRTPTTSPAPALSIEEPEDSDEEVVVFNPKAKRLSAQQKLPQSSPKENVDLKLAQSPKLNASQSPKQKVQRSPRKATPARQHQAKTPPVAPAIIDPDAFGRSFATNPRANVHNNHPNSRYSPRGSPRRAMRTLEPELEYILKSGNTRASVRGKGKLWVP